MDVSKMTAREMRHVISPSKDMYADALDLIVDAGWEFVRDKGSPEYAHGWWIHPDHHSKNRPRGDSKYLHFGAWDTLMLYVKPRESFGR